MTTFLQFEKNLKLCEKERESISYLTLLCSSSARDDMNREEVEKDPNHDHRKLNQNETKQTSCLSKIPLKPICTTQHFLSWFASIEEDMEEGQDDGFKDYVSKLEKSRDQIVKMESQVKSINQILDNLKLNFEIVTSKTHNLQNACEQLLDEQKHLVSVSEDISAKMKFFQELENISKALNQPGEELVKEAGFSDLLRKLDDCLEFVQAHVRDMM